MSMADIQEMLGEAILLSRIGHPNIVRVFDANVFETDGGACGYFTMGNILRAEISRNSGDLWQ